MNIYSEIIFAVSKGRLLILLSLVLLLMGNPSFAQNSIMYVSPRIKDAKSSEIASRIENNISNKIPDVKQKLGYFTYTDPNVGRKSFYNKIRASSIKYILKLDKIANENTSYRLDFSLSKINDGQAGDDKLYVEEEITWPNSAFIIDKNVGLTTEIDEILIDLNQEIKYYFLNGKFRSRIFINPKNFQPPEADFYTEFIDWLENEMHETEHIKQPDYIIYFDDKPYPQNSPYILYGKFEEADQDWADVQFYLIKNTKTQKSRIVRIYVKDFEFGEPEHADQYKQEIINKIYDLLSR